MQNPYEILGVPVTATIDEVKSAYRRVAKQTHPDLHGGSAEYAERFRMATDAYAVLSDPVQRRRFDAGEYVNQAQVSAATDSIYAAVAHVRSVAATARKTARAAALRGLAWLVGGLVITAIGYAAASSSGGTYFIMTGAIIFGGWQALRGLAAYVRIGAKASKIERDIWSTVTGTAGGPAPPGKVAPAGWFADPRGRHTHRYWDGTAWTEHVADNGQAGLDPII